MFRAQAAPSRPVHPSVMASGNETGVSTPFIPCHTAWGSARQVQKKKASSPQRLSAGERQTFFELLDKIMQSEGEPYETSRP